MHGVGKNSDLVESGEFVWVPLWCRESVLRVPRGWALCGLGLRNTEGQMQGASWLQVSLKHSIANWKKEHLAIVICIIRQDKWYNVYLYYHPQACGGIWTPSRLWNVSDPFDKSPGKTFFVNGNSSVTNPTDPGRRTENLGREILLD